MKTGTPRILIACAILLAVTLACSPMVGPGGWLWDTTQVTTVEITTEEQPAAQPEQQSAPAVVNTSNATTTAGGKYALVPMSEFKYDWHYSPLTDWTEGAEPIDSHPTSKGETEINDLGIRVGDFGVIKGLGVWIDGTYFGNGTGTNPSCSLVMVAPGFYRDIKMHEAIWERYHLPASNPLDPTGWSQSLALQAQQLEHDKYGCQIKSLDQIMVVISMEVAP